MKASKLIALSVAVLVAVSVIFPSSVLADAKRRIAIMPFENGAALSGHVHSLDVGKGIASLLTTKLVNDGTYVVIEREMLDSILKEQNLSVSDRADPATACKIGKILSVDCIVVGTITEFGFETHTANVGAAASAAAGYIPYGGFLSALGGVKHSSSKVHVSVDARLVDVNTTAILAAMQGNGLSQRSGTSIFAGGGYGWSGGSAGFDMGSSGFASTIAGEATKAAVEDMGTQLVAAAGKIPDNQAIAAANLEGKIADVTGTQVIVNVGKANGLAVGDNLQVQRPYKTIKDPDTGKILKELSNTIAVVSVSQVDSDTGTGNIVKGSGVRVGDTVKKIVTDVSAVVLESPAAGSSTPVRSISATGTILNQAAKASGKATK